LHQVIDPLILDSTCDLTNISFQGYGSHRGMTITGCDVTINPALAGTGFFSGDKGCGDISVRDSRFRCRNHDNIGFVHMNEGAANVVLDNVQFLNAPVASSSNAVYGVAGRGYRHQLNNVRIQSEGAVALVKFADSDGVLIDGCDLTVIGTGDSISIETSTNVNIGLNRYGKGGVVLHHLSPTAIPPRTLPTVLQAWVEYTDTTVALGYLPANAIIIRRSLKVVNAFDGSSPTISLGKVSDPTLLLGATAVNGGNTDDTFVLVTNPGLEVIATVGGSGASAGKVLAFIEFFYGVTPP
jgi:hypothetical protein